MIKQPRRRALKGLEFWNYTETRRPEMVSEAEAQAIALGLDGETHSDLLRAIVWQECTERSNGDSDRTRMICDWEMEAIKQNQTRDAVEQRISVVREISEEYIADPANYMTAEMQAGTSI